MKYLLLVLLFSGCSALAPLETKTAKEVAKAISTVCDEVDPMLRDRFVSNINVELENTPHLYTSACNARK